MGGWEFGLVWFLFLFSPSSFFFFLPWNVNRTLWIQGNAPFYLFCNPWNSSPEHKHVRIAETSIHILPKIYKFNLMGQISEKCVGLKAHKSPLLSWHELALRALYFSQIIPFVSEDILIPRDLKLPVNQAPNKRPPTVFAVNLLSPFSARNLGS